MARPMNHEQIFKFENTPKGYRAAKRFLVAIGKYETFLHSSPSVDGYSLVAFANECKIKIMTGQ